MTALSPSRVTAALAAAVTLLLLVAALATERSAGAAPGDQRPPSVLVGLLLPFQGHTEHGMVSLSVGSDASSVTIVTGGGDDALAYDIRLSSRRCPAISRNPSDPRFVGPSIHGNEGFINTTFDDESVAGFTRRHVRAARSVVLLASTGDGKFEPRACAATYKLEDVLISSFRDAAIHGLVAASPGPGRKVSVFMNIEGLPVTDGASTTYLVVANTRPCSQAVDVVDYVSWRTTVTSVNGIISDKATPKLVRAARRAKSVRVYDPAGAGEPVQLACGTFGRGT